MDGFRIDEPEVIFLSIVLVISMKGTDLRHGATNAHIETLLHPPCPAVLVHPLEFKVSDIVFVCCHEHVP